MTVTVYALVVASSAVTVYTIGLVKFCATPLLGLIDTPVCVIVGASAVTLVPRGTRTVMLVPLMAPTTPRLLKRKSVISLVEGRTTSTAPTSQCAPFGRV